ncbi:MAG TPA: hypothetical protein VIJ25_16620 [Methylococcales bacterium]
MKILFFLVVIANVALFMWEYRTGAFAPVTGITEQNADSDQEQILLVSELKNVPQVLAPAPVSEASPVENTAIDEVGKPALLSEPLPGITGNIDKPASEKSAATDSTITNANKMTERCYEAGPFANQKTYQVWVNRLKDINSEIKPINRDDQIPSNYMVYYPAGETGLESEANIKMLKDHGIKDLWLLTGEDKGKISLGLFNKEESALVMKSELLTKGINAEVKTRYKTRSQKYALIKGDDKLMERIDDLKKTYPELPVKPITDATQGCW